MNYLFSAKKALLFLTGALFFGSAILSAGYQELGKAVKTGEQPDEVSASANKAPVECVCHSKDPAILQMHQALGMRDCSPCHLGNENLMAKGTEKTADQKTATQARKRSDPICLECHRAGGEVKVEKSKVSGNWFCPTCQKQYSQSEAVKKIQDFYCPVVGQMLVDIDKIIKQSSKKPRNELCIACHPIESTLKRKHVKVLASSGKQLDDCLACHESHTKCGKCHL